MQPHQQRAMNVIIAAIVLISLLSGCEQKPAEYVSVCVESHVQMNIRYVPNGAGGIGMIPVSERICDKRETRRNPEYDKWISENKGG